MNPGEIVVAEWTGGGGQVLVLEVDNKTGEVVWRLNGTISCGRKMRMG